MIEPDTLAMIVNDARLSPEARSVVLYVACRGDGPQEIPHREFSRVLQGPGEKRLRRAIQDAVDLWLDRSIGGRGHSDTYSIRVVENADLTDRSASKSADLNDSPAAGADLSTLRVGKNADLNGAPTTTPTTTPTPPTEARERARPSDLDLKRLREYLGDHADAVDMMLNAAPDHGRVWAAAVLGKYGPNGTQPPSGVPPERRPAILATALIDFAGQGKAYTNRHFDGFFNTAAENERSGNGTRRETGRPATPIRGTTEKPDPNAKFRHREIAG